MNATKSLFSRSFNLSPRTRLKNSTVSSSVNKRPSSSLVLIGAVSGLARTSLCPILDGFKCLLLNSLIRSSYFKLSRLWQA